MMNNLSTFSGLEDEEDLEALRLAALQSLKKSAPLPVGNAAQIYTLSSPEQSTQFWQNKGFRNKKGKTFGNQYIGRGGRNGHFNRVRSTNLISIPTVPSESGIEDKTNSTEIKLNLPQNRYCNKDEDGEKSQDSSSKFDRYNNSDKSDSDDEDILLSDEESPQLKKSNSLEALMAELDNEIQGKPLTEEKIKTKKGKKRKKEVSTSESSVGVTQQNVSESNIQIKTASVVEAESTEVPKVPSEVSGEIINKQPEDFDSPLRKRQRSRSPLNRRNFFNHRRQRNYPHQHPNEPVMMPFGPGPVQFPTQMMPFNGQPFNPMFGPPGIMPNNQFYENPLPPLTIHTDPLPKPTLAPLSPRSAAFVLQNKAIIERRRRSPRRSYSRSPSRSHSRSLSPRRSPRWSVSPRRSPLRRLLPRKRSITPKRKSISPRRKSLSPRRKSISPRRVPLSPRRKSLSPRRKSVSPRRKSLSPRRRSLTPRRKSLSPKSPNKRKSISPKRKGGDGGSSRAPIRDRLGLKSRAEEKDKPKQTEEVIPKKEDIKPLDPILEARKRKFESNEIKMKEGIIRLRPKDVKVRDEKPIEMKQKEPKTNLDKPKEDRSKVDKMKDEKIKQEPKPNPITKTEVVVKDVKIEKEETRSTTPKPKESIVEVAPATTTTEDKQIDDSVPEEFKELEKLLLGGDDIELDPKVEDIFSDEDSASDNEGRFKVKEQKDGAKPPVIPFAKLMNGQKRDIKSEPLSKYTKNRDTASTTTRDRSDRDRTSTRKRTPIGDRKEKKEPVPTVIEKVAKQRRTPEKSVSSKSLAKQRISFRTERPPPPTMDKRFERKIEIKIKNPSKYERSGKSKVVAKNEVPSSSNSMNRKVSMDVEDNEIEEGEHIDDDDEDDDVEPEIIIDNGSDDEYSNFNEGDLRAQLSKKRAEKHKIPVEQVSSRLLKNALKGAVRLKSKKKSKDKDMTISEIERIKKFIHADYVSRRLCLSIKSDRKVRVYERENIEICYGRYNRFYTTDARPPIHHRLGLGSQFELYAEPRSKRKSRKRKNRDVLEQV